MIDCDSIFFSWYILKLHIVNIFKCVLAFGSDEDTAVSPKFKAFDDGPVERNI
jgi:hypothetical protein